MVLVEKIKNFIDNFNSIFYSDKGFNLFFDCLAKLLYSHFYA